MKDPLEGSLVLEKLAELDLAEDFYDAIDSDNLGKIVSLLRQADIDEETIQSILRMIQS